MPRPTAGDLGAVLRTRRSDMRTPAGKPLSPSDMAARINLGTEQEPRHPNAETVRRYEAGTQFPPLRVLIAKVLPAYGLTLLDWVKFAAGLGAHRTLAVLRGPGREMSSDADHLPRTTTAANGDMVIESCGRDLLANQEMSVTWVTLGPHISTKEFQQEFRRSVHAHLGEELLLVTEGDLVFTVMQSDGQERNIPLCKGEGVLLKSHQEHRAGNPGSANARYVVIWSPARPARLTLLGDD